MMDIECEIYQFMTIPEFIQKLKFNQEYIDWLFHTRSFGSWIEYGALGVRNIGFRIDKEVVNHVAALEVIDKRINFYQIKYHHFKKFITSELTDDELKTLEVKYANREFKKKPFTRIDDLVFEEISEINEYMMHRYGIWHDQNSIVWDVEEVKEIIATMKLEVGVCE